MESTSTTANALMNVSRSHSRGATRTVNMVNTRTSSDVMSHSKVAPKKVDLPQKHDTDLEFDVDSAVQRIINKTLY